MTLEDSNNKSEKNKPVSKEEKSIDESLVSVYVDVNSNQILKSSFEEKSWEKSKAIVQKFSPVPWFVWTLSNYIFSRQLKGKKVPEGAYFGFKSLLLNAASDKVLGIGQEVKEHRKAASILTPDVFGSTVIIYSISRKLKSQENYKFIIPLLEDAYLRAQIGFFLGKLDDDFGAGKAMLAGFAGRLGILVLIAQGTTEQATKSLEKLANSESINEVGKSVYGCEPLHVSAFTLTASGMGKDAAFGVVNFGCGLKLIASDTLIQKKWQILMFIIEKIRFGKASEVSPEYLAELKSNLTMEDLIELEEVTKEIQKDSGSWKWMQ